MNNPEIAPIVRIGGSAFQDHSLNSSYPLAYLPSRQATHVVSLASWCRNNFISRDIGYTLIRKKLLIAFRQHGQWWVRSNPDCYEQLIEYLGVEELLFDAPNN